MTKLLPNKRVLLSVIALFFSLHAFSQLPAFNFSVTVTNQTCLNNGALNFTVSGLQPGATVTYAVYLLPNTTTPVITTTNTNVPGLGAGNYSITATQSLNGQTSTNTQTAVINNLIVPLTYTLGFTKVRCVNDGTITATIASGTASTYAIIAGPVTKPPQASNVFTGLPIGLYSVRVTDNCGEAVVVSITVTKATTNILIGDPVFTAELPACNLIHVANALTVIPGDIIFFPVTVQYTVNPPGGGAPIILTLPNVTTGDGAQFDIPFYNNQQYSYSIKITDACGNVFTKNIIINEKFDVDLGTEVEGCGDNFFFFDVTNFKSPINVVFTASPAGFTPSSININHPNFTNPHIEYGGNGVYVPEGNYTAVFSDSCGRTVTISFEVNDEDRDPIQVSGDPAVCGSDGSISLHYPEVKIVHVVMTSAPPGYPGPFPMDVSAYIDSEGYFEITGLPLGDYTFLVTDECGFVEEVEASVTGAPGGGLTVLHRPGCEVGVGSVRIASSQELLSLQITAAPPSFPSPLPFNGTPYIAADGRFYMNSLPAGNYTVQAVNACGGTSTQNFMITGYGISVNDVEIIPHCGSFDVALNHISNGNYVPGYYLQKYNPVNNTWGHPQTGMAYVDGQQANSLNSIVLLNQTTNLSYAYTGEFRVLKTFFVYDNGTIANIRCTQVLKTFTFDGGPVITDAFSFPCSTGLTEVAVMAEGVPPLTYSITTKEGQPFTVNNGQSNLFTGLESATYNFRVTDVCGNIRNIVLDIDALDPVAIQPEGFCEGEDSKLSVPEFTFLTYKWYKEGTPATVLSTTGTLNFPDYESVTDAGVYHLSITSSNPLSCMNQELTFSLLENAQPEAGNDITTQFCNDGQGVDLRDFLATGVVTNGHWEDTNSTGMLTNSMLTTAGLPAGTYQFRYIVSGLCNLSDDAILTLEVKDIPQLPVISSNVPHCEGSDIQFGATAVAGAVYQWTGPNGFTSSAQAPLLSNVSVNAAGTYSLAVTVNGCTSAVASLDVVVNAAPKAGDDTIVPLCNEGNSIDLEDYLSGAFDNGGVWENVDDVSGFNGNTLNTTGIAEGTYQFRYTVTNICNSTDEAFISVQLKDIPDAPSLTALAPVCEGTDVQLQAETIAGATYQWTGPGSFTSAEQNPLIAAPAVAASGNYSVTVTVNDCTSAAAVVPLTVNAYPQFTVEGNTALCEGQSSLLTVVPGNFTAASYKWYLEGELLNETSASLPISQLGTYQVEVDNSSCISSREIEVELNDNPFELVLESGCRNYDYMLWVANIAEISGAVISWTGPNNFSFNGPEANITNMTPGEYTATVTNSEGCTAMASLTIDNTSCIIPRGISPNGDGFNDSFDLSNLEVIELKIFNRYGLKVYEAQNYIDEWHGQSDKGTLPTATYYYMITLSGGKQVTGWVYLQREE